MNTQPNTPTTSTSTWRKSSRSGTRLEGNCVEIARVPRPVPGDCHGACTCCGGDGQMGSSPCTVCSGTGNCGCH